MSKRIVQATPTSAQTIALSASSTAVMEAPAEMEPVAVRVSAPKAAPPAARKLRMLPPVQAAKRFAAAQTDEHGSNRQAELFYLQKQIQLQTQMVVILEDGTRVQGVIEWYDRNSIKIRGKLRMLVYKSAIKYLYKAGEVGSASEE
jgi:sRNA-binding regulator protein Hfq